MRQTFLFDMDGLLLDTERVYRLAFCDMMERLGCASEQDTSFFDALVGSSWPEQEKALRSYIPERVTMDTITATWKEMSKARFQHDVPVKPTVRNVLSTLRGQDARMAVVTSTHTDHAMENLEKAGLLEFFACVTGGDAVSANKPNPAPYLETAEKLGVVASDCFAFEDSDRGITAAVGAGCTAVQIPDLRPPNTPLPRLGQYVARDLQAAMRLLNVL